MSKKPKVSNWTLNEFLTSVTSDGIEISSMRVVFLLAMFTFVPTVLAMWTYFSFKAGTMQDIPMGVVSVLLTFLAGKVGQSYLEK